VASITQFSGEYHFLSNFYPSSSTLEGRVYPTVEHALQAAKSLNPEDRESIRKAASPSIAKQLGRQVTLREDWEQVKVGIMLDLLRQKFSDPALRSGLRKTGDAELIESNAWGDRFWGMCDGRGSNMLGILLMTVRSELPKAGFLPGDDIAAERGYTGYSHSADRTHATYVHEGVFLDIWAMKDGLRAKFSFVYRFLQVSTGDFGLPNPHFHEFERRIVQAHTILERFG